MVEDRVDPVGCKGTRLRGHVAAVVDPTRAERLDGRGVPRGRGADDPDPGGAGKLDKRRADAAVGAVHEDGLTGPDLRDPVQHLPRGDAVDDERLGVGRIEPGRHGNKIGGVEHDVAAPPSDFRQRGHALPNQRSVHAIADLGDDADQVVAGHERKRWLVVVLAAAHLLFGERDAGGLHAHHDLSGDRRGETAVGQLQPVGVNTSWQDDFHGGGGFGGRRCHVLLLVCDWSITL